MRVLLDQGAPRGAVQLLRAEGWDVVHTAERGLGKATDQQIIAAAKKEGRICVTLDADFHALLAVSGEARPSVIRLRYEGLRAAEFTELLQNTWKRVGWILEQGALVTVTPKGIRTHRLPVLRPNKNGGLR